MMEFKAMMMLLLAGAAFAAVAGSAEGYYSFGIDGGNTSGSEKDESGGNVTYYYSTVTMESFASESVKPDLAKFSVTIETFDAGSKAESARRNAEIAKRVKEGLVAAGINQSDMATESYSVNERYNNSYEYGYYEGTVLDGYTTRHVIRVETDRLDSLGSFFDAALNSGASDVGDVRWSLKEETVLELQKRLSKEAIENVNEKVVYAFPEAEEYQLYTLNESLSYGSWNYYPGYTYGASWYGFTDGDEMTEVEIPDVELKVNAVAQYVIRDLDAPSGW